MLSAFALKIIAIVSMLIDHVGAVLLPDVIELRYIGRLAFPIFCFLIAEGYAHTKNAPKYLSRLGLFALISELPFNLAFRGELLYFGSCNVFITLFLGLLAIMLFEAVLKWDGLSGFLSQLIALVPVVCLAAAADSIGSDYGKYGVVLIFIFHIFREHRTAALLVFAFSTILKYDIIAANHNAGTYLFKASDRQWYFVESTQMYCILAALPIALYSGKRGRGGLKWLFYVFYPAHLMLLWLINLFVR